MYYGVLWDATFKGTIENKVVLLLFVSLFYDLNDHGKQKANVWALIHSYLV